ncbi:MAG: hypothetical protein KA821_13160 [Chitinophagaceae bacterium]|nr:hypothetical protein [Chitinophagaceae bacterium]
MHSHEAKIMFLLLISSGILLLFAAAIVALLTLHKRDQLHAEQHYEELKSDFEKNLLSARLEMQELTFQEISREIHDNINLALTLAKLHLNTFSWDEREKAMQKITSSVELLSEAIEKLRNISKELNAELISSQGLIKAIEREIEKIENTNLFDIRLRIIGEPVFMKTNAELIVFRIIQEALNNIIKHSQAQKVEITLAYLRNSLFLRILDYGIGFDYGRNVHSIPGQGAGLMNMMTRTRMMGGTMQIRSEIDKGTSLQFSFPY